MKARLTINLSKSVARWVREEAVRNGTSESRFVEDVLKRQVATDDLYAKAVRRALARRAIPQN